MDGYDVEFWTLSYPKVTYRVLNLSLLNLIMQFKRTISNKNLYF